MIYTTLKKVIDFHRALAVDSFKLPVTNPDGNASAICIRQTDYEFRQFYCRNACRFSVKILPFHSG